jgi:hypothetical protein
MKKIFVLTFLNFLFVTLTHAQVEKKANTKMAVIENKNVKDSTQNTLKSDAFLKVKKKTPEQLAMQKHPSKIDSTKTAHPHL